MLFNKKDKYKNSDWENYTSYSEDLIKLGVLLLVIAVIYGLYQLYLYLFS